MSVFHKVVEVKKTEVPAEKIDVIKPKKDTEITPTEGMVEASDLSMSALNFLCLLIQSNSVSLLNEFT